MNFRPRCKVHSWGFSFSVLCDLGLFFFFFVGKFNEFSALCAVAIQQSLSKLTLCKQFV